MLPEGGDPFPTEVVELTAAERRVLDIAGRLMQKAALLSSQSICYARQAAQLEAFVKVLADEPLTEIANGAEQAFPELFAN